MVSPSHHTSHLYPFAQHAMAQAYPFGTPSGLSHAHTHDMAFAQGPAYPMPPMDYDRMDQDEEDDLEVDGEDDGDIDGGGDGGGESRGTGGGAFGRSGSAESTKKDGEKDSPKKKPRITLARGGACVACRNRKLKCSGEKPCKTCQKANIECRYEEIQRKKPRAVLLEERVAELESMLLARGEALPPSQLSSSSAQVAALSASPVRDDSDARQSSRSSGTSGAISPPGPPPLSLLSHHDLQPGSSFSHSHSHSHSHSYSYSAASSVPANVPASVRVNTARTEIPPNSALEFTLINIILPYTPHLGMPVHPQRFLALLSLPPNDPQRPHPAFLYILFTEAVWVLERNVPPPQPIHPPASLFPSAFPSPSPFPASSPLVSGQPQLQSVGVGGVGVGVGVGGATPTPAPTMHILDPNYVLHLVGGTSSALLERARAEFDQGIRNVDRPLDLVRAGVGIARHLYSLGRFIEGWSVPVSRLLVSCGLHRMTGNVYPPETAAVHSHSQAQVHQAAQPTPGLPGDHMAVNLGSTVGNIAVVPPPYLPSQQYGTSYAASSVPGLSVLRMRPVIIPPARDAIDLAERTMVFWAAKMQDWVAGVGWGWALGIADDECTTQWGWGWGGAEIKPHTTDHLRYSIRDLYDPSSPMHTSPFPDTTFVLACKSLALLHRASHLFDRPESSYPLPLADGRLLPSHIPALAQVQSVETAIRLFRARIPAPFADMPSHTVSANTNGTTHGNGNGNGHASTSSSSLPSTNPSPTHSQSRMRLGDDDLSSIGGGGAGGGRYEPFADPWWIMLHMNLYTAEMMMYKEMAHHQRTAYETAVSCARAIVGLCQRLPPDSWVHVEMIVALDLSLAARFLFKESSRLAKSNQPQAANMAAEEAELLRTVLARDYARWSPMASLHGLIVQRVREGWPEKEGEYERL